jgi:hypothetical protein
MIFLLFGEKTKSPQVEVEKKASLKKPINVDDIHKKLSSEVVLEDLEETTGMKTETLEIQDPKLYFGTATQSSALNGSISVEESFKAFQASIKSWTPNLQAVQCFLNLFLFFLVDEEFFIFRQLSRRTSPSEFMMN